MARLIKYSFLVLILIFSSSLSSYADPSEPIGKVPKVKAPKGKMPAHTTKHRRVKHPKKLSHVLNRTKHHIPVASKSRKRKNEISAIGRGKDPRTKNIHY